MCKADRLLLPPQEFAKLVGLGRDDTYGEIATGRIRALRRGRRLLVPVTEAERWIAEELERQESVRP